MKSEFPFLGYDHAHKINEDRNGFSTEDREYQTQKIKHRVIDVVFFSQGELTELDRPKVSTQYIKESTDQSLFSVPKDTKIYDYNPVQEKGAGYSKEKLLKLQIREELVRGYRVQPEYICHPGESCVDHLDHNQIFNG